MGLFGPSKKEIMMANVRAVEEQTRVSESIAREHDRTQERIAEADIKAREKELKARDRVDITLEKYEEMAEKIKFLEETNRHLKVLLEKLYVPVNCKIIPETVERSIGRNDRTGNQRCYIKFDVEVE